MGFLIMKGNGYYNIQKKFQVHSTNVIWIKSKNKYRQVNPAPLSPSLVAYSTHTLFKRSLYPLVVVS